MNAASEQDPIDPECVKTVLVTRREGSQGVTLDITARHPSEVKVFHAPALNASGEALEVYTALCELPVETRRALQLLISENGETFAGVASQRSRGQRVHEPLKGGR